jgi:hypothetical protein
MCVHVAGCVCVRCVFVCLCVCVWWVRWMLAVSSRLLLSFSYVLVISCFCVCRMMVMTLPTRMKCSTILRIPGRRKFPPLAALLQCEWFTLQFLDMRCHCASLVASQADHCYLCRRFQVKHTCKTNFRSYLKLWSYWQIFRMQQGKCLLSENFSM